MKIRIGSILCAAPFVAGFQIRQKRGQQADRRQERAHPVYKGDAGSIRPPAMPNARPKNNPEIMPILPGTRSCANTMMAENADANTSPITTLRIVVQSEEHTAALQSPWNLV